MNSIEQQIRDRANELGFVACGFARANAADEAGLALPGGLPRIQRTLNWVHVSQRFPVKIRVDDPNPELFRVGTSAVAVLHPGSDGASH